MNQHARDSLDDSAILEHSQTPYHRGHVANPTCARGGRNPVCGDWVYLELVTGGGGRVEQAWFDGRGCVISQAAASILCESIEGRTIAELRNFGAQQMLDQLRLPLSPGRRQCGLLAFEVLKVMIAVPDLAGASGTV